MDKFPSIVQPPWTSLGFKILHSRRGKDLSTLRHFVSQKSTVLFGKDSHFQIPFSKQAHQQGKRNFTPHVNYILVSNRIYNFGDTRTTPLGLCRRATTSAAEDLAQIFWVIWHTFLTEVVGLWLTDPFNH